LFLLTVIEPRSNPEQGDTADIAALLETGIITTIRFNYQGFLGSYFANLPETSIFRKVKAIEG
jgi:hypothetical protein